MELLDVINEALKKETVDFKLDSLHMNKNTFNMLYKNNVKIIDFYNCNTYNSLCNREESYICQIISNPIKVFGIFIDKNYKDYKIYPKYFLEDDICIKQDNKEYIDIISSFQDFVNKKCEEFKKYINK